MPGGAVHKLPSDLRASLIASPKALEAWKDITPLARNEFICWVEDAKQAATERDASAGQVRSSRTGCDDPAAGQGAGIGSATAASSARRQRSEAKCARGALLDEADAVAESDQNDPNSWVLGDPGVELPDRHDVVVCSGGVDHPAALEHVVEEDHPAGPQASEDLLVVVAVAGLVGVDEGEVEVLPRRKRSERLEGGPELQLDAVVHPCCLPGVASYRGPLLAQIAAEQMALRAEAPCDGQGGVTREGAELDRLLGSHRPHNHLDQERLVIADLHASGSPGLRLGEALQHQLVLVGGRGARRGVLIDRHVDEAAPPTRSRPSQSALLLVPRLPKGTQDHLLRLEMVGAAVSGSTVHGTRCLSICGTPLVRWAHGSGQVLRASRARRRAVGA